MRSSARNADADARAALAGMSAAAVWAAAEPALRRLFGTPYSDVRLIGGNENAAF